MSDKWVIGSDGCLELLNEKGEVIAREKVKAYRRMDKKGAVTLGCIGKKALLKLGEHMVLDANGERVWCPPGTNPDCFPRTIYPYSQITCDHILAFVTEGHTLKEIGQMAGVPPYRIIMSWIRKYPKFKAQLKEARKCRAELFHDTALEIAHKTKGKQVHADRLKIDTLKWAAEVNDPENFGKRVKMSGDAENPLSLTVDTGIRREGDETPPEPASLPPPEETNG